MVVKKNSISFIIPAYNAELYLADCIKSILEVVRSGDEIIIVNDGSIDRTKIIANNFALLNKKVIVISQNNSGVSAARNRGILAAKNNYIMFVDSDDLISESFKKLERNFGGKDIIYYVRDISKNISKNSMLFHLACLQNPSIPEPFSKIFNKSFLIKNSITFPKGIINGEDMLFNIKALLLANKYKIINKSFYKYRIIEGTATKSFDKNIITSDKKYYSIMNELIYSYGANYKNELEQIKYFNQNNAIIMILNRISYIKNYKEAQPFFNYLLDEPYKNTLKHPCDIKQKIIFMLCRKKMYRLLYEIFRIKRINNCKKEYFKEI